MYESTSTYDERIAALAQNYRSIVRMNLAGPEAIAAYHAASDAHILGMDRLASDYRTSYSAVLADVREVCAQVRSAETRARIAVYGS